VSAITGVEPYILRYWETEFREVKPIRARSGQRLYRRKDVELILKIKELLYKHKYTIAGAKKHLRSVERGKEPSSKSTKTVTLQEIKSELMEIRRLLS